MASTNDLLYCRETMTFPNFKILLPQLIDATALIGHVCKEISYKRKEEIKPILHPEYRPLCSRTHKVGKLLFGDDLSKTVQDLRSSNKAVSQLTYNANQTASGSRFKPSYSSNQSNKSFLSQKGRTQFPPKRHVPRNKKPFTRN